MSTAVVYVDEAGSPYPHHEPLANGDTPLFSLVGLALPLDRWRQRDRDYLCLKRQFFPDEMGRSDRRDEEMEIKGRELTSPRQRNSPRRQEFNRRVLTYINQANGRTFAVSFLKSARKPAPHHSIYTTALQILVERISLYVAEHSSFTHALLICDSRMKGPSGLDLDVARSHMSYVFGNQTGRTFTNIVEAPLFADSRLTVGLQLVDVIASNIYANHYDYYLRNVPGALNYGHMRRTWPLLDQMQFKSSELVEGRTVFGYRVINQRDARKDPAAG